MRADLAETERFEAIAIEPRVATEETVLVAAGRVLAGEGFEEGDAAAEFGQARQAAVEFAVSGSSR